ncbi:hypothetical protein AJ78_07358 [Emergomyces pasteurianus Ep9510]|uniref:Acyltransferase 3 domain-containing protein n=1 Tax=Emergomyces pasteurianus Ep9510 TaxID=1447872 RepID=A0A1J9Q6Y0_9EURO|nr:hypothetical protein AJ78_07358 [Emergomyces pasteurianus Ep9510]
MLNRGSLHRACHQKSTASPKYHPAPIDDKAASRLHFSPGFPSGKNYHVNHNNRDDCPDSDSVFFEERSMQPLERLFVAISPSFLHHLIKPTSKHHAPQKLHKIAALEGLRGWACLLVFNFHFLFTYTHKTGVGWGLDENNLGIHQLPFIHMLISGHVMVTLFFVISGYVLSYKPLKLLRSHSWEQAFHTLASSTIRRGLRLYLPSIAGTFFVFIAVRLGCFRYSTWVRDEGHTILGTNEQHPPYFESFIEQFGDWYLTVSHLLDPWNWNLYYNFYNPHLWTIPIEFRSSMFLFLTILSVSRFRAWIRLTLVSCLLFYCIRWGRWDVVLFLSGMLMAEVDLIQGIWENPLAIPSNSSDSNPLQILREHELAHDNTNSPVDHHLDTFHSTTGTDDHEDAQYTTYVTGSSSGWSCHHTPNRLLWLSLFIVGLFIGSSPNNSPQHTPFYRTLSSILTPNTYMEPHRFLQSLGSIIIVFSLNRSADLQRMFTNALAQYLGKISYAFYIVHGPILHSLGWSLMPNIWEVTGKETDAQFCVGLLIGWLICLSVSIWVADLFWRGVDTPAVKFAKRVERQLMVAGL